MSHAPERGLAEVGHRASGDIVVIAAASLGAFALGAAFDLFGGLHAFAARHDDLLMDELFFGAFVTTLGFAVFAYRRWRDLREAYAYLAIEQRRLLASEKMASIGRLTAGIAHEMNTPLGAARTSLARLGTLGREYEASIGEAGVGPDDHREIAREIQEAAALGERGVERAVGFVASLRRQTRVQDDEAARDFDVHEVIREALLLARHRLRSAKCEVRWEPQDGPLTLFGAPGQLSQVMINLLVNAADASAADGGAIDLRVAPSNGHLVIEVEDEGSGIAPEVLPRIFEPFFTTKASHEGTGLGLALTHDIVHGLGGTIEVDSILGRGTTFRVRLPADGKEKDRHGAHS
jgi:signal transduction histidine kinase